MRKFHSILIGDVQADLKSNGLSTLERSTLYRLEKRLGFDKEGRTRREWRIYSPEEAAAFKIAVLNHYGKPLPRNLEKLAEDQKVITVLNAAKEKELQRKAVELAEMNESQSVSAL